MGQVKIFVLGVSRVGGYLVNFQHNKLLTDWRGEAITSPIKYLFTGSVSTLGLQVHSEIRKKLMVTTNWNKKLS